MVYFLSFDTRKKCPLLYLCCTKSWVFCMQSVDDSISFSSTNFLKQTVILLNTAAVNSTDLIHQIKVNTPKVSLLSADVHFFFKVPVLFHSLVHLKAKIQHCLVHALRFKLFPFLPILTSRHKIFNSFWPHGFIDHRCSSLLAYPVFFIVETLCVSVLLNR